MRWRALSMLIACVSIFLIPFASPAQALDGGSLNVADRDEIPNLPYHARYIYYPMPETDESEPVPSQIPLGEVRQYIGTQDDMTLTELRAMPAGEGYTDGPYALGPMWAYVTLTNSGSEHMRWRLDFREADGPAIRVFAAEPGMADRLILENRWLFLPISDRLPQERLVASAPFDVPPGETVTLWFDAEFGMPTEGYFRLVEETRFSADRQRDVSLFATVIGFRIALLLALLSFAFVLRDRTALAYAGFHGGLMLTSLTNAGFDQFYLGLTDAVSGVIFRLTIAFALVSYMLTLRFFLDTPGRYPRYNKVLLASTALGLLSLPLLSFMDITVALNVARSYIEAALVLQFAVVACIGIVLGLRDRLPGAALFLAASGILMFFAAMQAFFAAQSALMPVWQSLDLSNGVLAVDGLIFAGALVLRAVDIRRQRDSVQEEKMQALADRAALAEQLDAAQRNYAEVAELAERRRRDLAATSHDLKQPLLSLQMALSKMENAESAAQGVSYIEQVLQRNLDQTRPAAPARVEKESGFELGTAIRNAVLMFEDEAAQKGIHLAHVPTSVRAMAEPVVLMRILTNLLANAINHSGASRIVIAVRRGPAGLGVMVADNGKGIPPDQLGTIFGAYRAGEGSRGEGLGLSVVRELADKQGWTIDVAALPGGGTAFCVRGIAAAATQQE